MTLTTLLVPSAYVYYNNCMFYVMQISLDQQKSSWHNKHDVKVAWKQTDDKCWKFDVPRNNLKIFKRILLLIVTS